MQLQFINHIPREHINQMCHLFRINRTHVHKYVNDIQVLKPFGTILRNSTRLQIIPAKYTCKVDKFQHI